MKNKLKNVFVPNMLRGHAVLLSSFITGNIYFLIAVSGFSAALGLVAGIITAPIGVLAGAATLYVIRKASNMELSILEKEAKRHDIELNMIPSIEGGDLLETSKELYLDTKSWKALLISLAKFPVGMASLILITTYISLSTALVLSPLLYRTIDFQVYGTTLTTPPELTAAVIAGLTIYIVGVNITEKASKLYLKLNSMI
ncbi:sensor domain-containing protein [Candidatus Nanohalobium constans]|uniref:Putative sensor domain-containing protein n=1 Tax=Candidatus Nanohalobium constans TaxID=2565781 RepID=A0A5Q0UFA2_9ARCH|nr:sensor domain-containing protein [Candidatus Nanohalobium constans]QGA80236.1 hypothetical protein LC1Nh_0335 [Candidatus Nanohalobium constans]